MDKQVVKYPIGIQDFEGLIKDGYLYVDKTEILYNLVNYGKMFFLARPRRFGKSLMLSTLKAYFEGKKDLFEGLAIYNLEKEWEKHPVFLLGLSRTNPSEPDSLKSVIDQQFRWWERKYGIDGKGKDLSSRFADLIVTAHHATGKRVVILVDEYDNPLINTSRKLDLYEKNHDILKSLYSSLKDLDAHIKFGMLTGVTRFSKLTIFSGLNNLQDITLDNPFASICGISENELHDNFKTGIEAMGSAHGWDFEKTVGELKKLYDGYHFTGDSPDIYNPFSILNAMAKQKLGNYWFYTGIPSFLVEKMKAGDVDLQKAMSPKADEQMLKEIDSAKNSSMATLFQAGFLTIKKYDSLRDLYLLGIPNEEVKQGMARLFMEYFLYDDKLMTGQSLVFDLIDFANEGKPDEFLYTLKTFFAGVPFEMSKGSKEVFFHNSFYILSCLIGLKTRTEYHTSEGSIDMVIETQQFIYIFELKLDKSAQEALNQINHKDYSLPFVKSGKKIFKIGVNFSSKSRNIDSWIVE